MKGSNFIEKYGNIRVLGIVLFALASIFCLYKIYDLQGKPSDAYKKPIHTTSLKLLSVIGRHGDRAPSDVFPLNDKHADMINFLWPNGYSNLTDIGIMRQFRIGLELRRRYRDFLSFNSSHYLAFSSGIVRCQQSLNHTLRGLFQIQWPTETGRRFADLYNAERGCLTANGTATNSSSSCQNKPIKGLKNLYLPEGSGSPNEYRNISIDTNTVPTLDWRYLENCKYFQKHPPGVVTDLMSSKAIASLKGINKLAELLRKNYKFDFDTHAANSWSTIQEEIRLARTTGTLEAGQHYYGWINERVPGYKPESGITYLDLFAQMVVYYYRERLSGKANLIELTPIVTSIVESQKQALNRPQRTNATNATIATIATAPKTSLEPVANKSFNSPELFKDKKAIFYSTHDATVQAIMQMLNMTYHEHGDFETRFNKWHRADDVDRNLAGLRMVEFGASLVLELYETEVKEREGGVWKTTKRFPYVQAAFYNEEDIIVKPVSYKRLKFGTMCKDKFKKIYGNSTTNVKQLLKEKFFDQDIPLDTDYSCPFELFKNITSEFLLNKTGLDNLCGSQ